MTDERWEMLAKLGAKLDGACDMLEELHSALRRAEQSAEALGWIRPEIHCAFREWVLTRLDDGSRRCPICQRVAEQIRAHQDFSP